MKKITEKEIQSEQTRERRMDQGDAGEMGSAVAAAERLEGCAAETWRAFSPDQ